MVSTQTDRKSKREYSQGQEWGARGDIKKRRTTAATTNGNNVVTTTRAKYSVVTNVCVCVCV